MSQVYILLPLFVLFSVRLVYGYPGDTVMLLPPYEMQTADSYSSYPYPSQFQANRQKPRQVLHNMVQRNPPQALITEKPIEQNMNFGEFLEALNEVSHHKEDEFQRPRTAAAAGRDDNPSYSSRPMGYSRPNYAPPATYNETPALVPSPPPTSAQPKLSLLKPDLSSLLTPVATKAPGKLNGLLSLLFSLLTGGSSGLQLTGLKDILIEGIIRPLLIAKGGIKALISKLSIPVISLLLINLEVLITVWWLWEECPAKLEPTPSYSKPAEPTSYSKPAYTTNYNSYS